MNRIESVRFKLPQEGQHHVLVYLEGGQELRFNQGEMYAEMRRTGLMRHKAYIIHEMLLARATNGRHPNEGVQTLLAEFRFAAERLGANIENGLPKRQRRRRRPEGGANRKSPPAQ